MGKTYKERPVERFLDDDLVDLESDEIDFDDDMEFLQLDAPHKRQKHPRGRRKNSDPYMSSNMHRLPADWSDFDYSNGSSLDDWR